MRATLAVLLFTFSGLALSFEEDARLERHGSYSTLIADTSRPLEAIGIELARSFGISVSAEDPSFQYTGDMRDISKEVANMKPGALVPGRWKLQVHFPVKADGSLALEPSALLQKIVDAANAKTPYAYRLDQDGTAYFFVPTRTRDPQGRSIAVTPLLDRRVTIPAGSRKMLEVAELMSKELSAQTGLTVSCCQAFVAGIPWGLETIQFEANDEPARGVLKRLGFLYWQVRCDESSCFIDPLSQLYSRPK